MQLNTVVLPAPLGPISPNISPFFTSKLRSSTAFSPPKYIFSPRTRSATSSGRDIRLWPEPFARAMRVSSAASFFSSAAFSAAVLLTRSALGFCFAGAGFRSAPPRSSRAANALRLSSMRASFFSCVRSASSKLPPSRTARNIAFAAA